MSAVYNPLTGAAYETNKRKVVTSTFTRPANTTAYAAGDAVNNSTSAPTVLTMSDCASRQGGSGRIVSAILETNNATVTNGDFRAYVFNASFTPANDNAAFAELHANAAGLLGWIDFDTLTADGASAAAASARAGENFGGEDDGLPLEFVCASGNDDLYVVLVAQGAYTPASGQVFRLTFIIETD